MLASIETDSTVCCHGSLPTGSTAGQFVFIHNAAAFLLTLISALKWVYRHSDLGHDSRSHGVCLCLFRNRFAICALHVEELLSVIASRAAAECERMHFVRELSRSENSNAVQLDRRSDCWWYVLRSYFGSPSAVKFWAMWRNRIAVGKAFGNWLNLNVKNVNFSPLHGMPFYYCNWQRV